MRHELAALDIERMRGLEIGPLASPRIRKDEGDVRYVDHAGTEELKQKYAQDLDMHGRLDQIVEVDYVIGKDQTISEAVASEAPFDYVLAAHVIEHIPDPVGWIADVTRVLRPGGILSLVIPDKRYCFDINRPLTEISELVDAYLRKLRQPSFRQAYEFWSKALVDVVDPDAVWSGTADYSLSAPTNVDDPDTTALDGCLHMQQSDEFVDVHCSVFPPDSFLGLFEKLVRLGLLDYEIAAFLPTQAMTFEFYVSLRRLEFSSDRESMMQRQRASLARAYAKLRSGDTASPAMVAIPVSRLEI